VLGLEQRGARVGTERCQGWNREVPRLEQRGARVGTERCQSWNREEPGLEQRAARVGTEVLGLEQRC